MGTLFKMCLFSIWGREVLSKWINPEPEYFVDTNKCSEKKIKQGNYDNFH